jgi:hypothetical protein
MYGAFCCGRPTISVIPLKKDNRLVFMSCPRDDRGSIPYHNHDVSQFGFSTQRGYGYSSSPSGTGVSQDYDFTPFGGDAPAIRHEENITLQRDPSPVEGERAVAALF